MNTREACSILGIQPGADLARVKAAFRRKAIATHPDSAGSSPQAMHVFTQVKAAYDYLVANGSAVESLFSTSRPRNGQSISVTLKVRLEDIANAALLDIPQAAPVCEVCKGSGKAKSRSPVRCGACGGEGHTVSYFGVMSTRTKCQQCDGAGETHIIACLACGATGKNPLGRKLSFRVPPGTEDGHTVTIPHGGAPGIDGGEAGNLKVLVQFLPHERFRSRGTDILLEEVISFSDLVLGATLSIPGLGGALHQVEVKAGSPSGVVLSVAGGGLPTANGTKGRLLVRLQPIVPQQPSPERIAIANMWRATDIKERKLNP